MPIHTATTGAALGEQRGSRRQDPFEGIDYGTSASELFVAAVSAIHRVEPRINLLVVLNYDCDGRADHRDRRNN